MIPTADQSAQLVTRAAAGDRQAWNALVDAYAGLVWATVRRHRMSENDARDVCQTVWLRLVEHIDRLNQPARVGTWLATTTKRECLRVQAQTRRVLPLGDHEVLESVEDETGAVDSDLLRQETAEEVQAALAQLPLHWQQLLRRLMADPSRSYHDVAAELNIPVGSIGPTRGRSLRKLREVLVSSAAGSHDTDVA